MGLDIRLPIGLMFSVLGPMLVITGLVNDTFLNLYTGAAMTLFGAFMTLFGVMGQRRANAAERAEAAAKEAAAPRADRSREESPLTRVA